MRRRHAMMYPLDLGGSAPNMRLHGRAGLICAGATVLSRHFHPYIQLYLAWTRFRLFPALHVSCPPPGKPFWLLPKCCTHARFLDSMPCPLGPVHLQRAVMPSTASPTSPRAPLEARLALSKPSSACAPLPNPTLSHPHPRRTVEDLRLKISVTGACIAGVSVVSSGLQQIFVRNLQQKHGLSSHELLSNTAPAQAWTLLVVGPFVDKVVSGGWVFHYTLTHGALVWLIGSCILAVLVNITQFMCLGRFSAVSFQVCMCVWEGF